MADPASEAGGWRPDIEDATPSKPRGTRSALGDSVCGGKPAGAHRAERRASHSNMGSLRTRAAGTGWHQATGLDTAKHPAVNKFRASAREVDVVLPPLGHRSAASHVEERLSYRTTPTRTGRSTRSVLGHRLGGGLANLSLDQTRP